VEDWPVCERHRVPLALFCDLRGRSSFQLCPACAQETGRPPCLVRGDDGSWFSATIGRRERRPDGWWASVWWIDPGDASATAHWVPYERLVPVR